MTQTSFIACLRFSALDGCLYATLSFITVHRFSTGLRPGLFPGHSSRDLVFLQELGGYLCSVTGNAILHEDRAAVDVHVQFQLLYEQFHVLRSIYGSVLRNEIHTNSVTIRQCTPNNLVRRAFHCGNIFLVETLTQCPPNVHVARYKLLHGAFVRKQHLLPLSESPMAMTSGKVQSLFLHHWCQVWLSCRPVGLL